MIPVAGVRSPDEVRRMIALGVAKEVAGHVANRYEHDGVTWSEETADNYEAKIEAMIVASLKMYGERLGTDGLLALAEIDPNEDNLDQLDVLLDALKIHDERNRRYKSVWKESGWRGALHDLRKKAGRLFRQYWGPEPTEGANDDDAYDLINFAAFYIRGKQEKNEWGKWLEG